MMGLSRGVATWLESGREKRNLGMAGIAAVLQALGEKGPEWDHEDISLKEELVPILYIRDIIHLLSDTESLQGKRCLELVPSLAASHLKHEDPILATELLRLLLHVENRTEDQEFPALKRKAVEAVVVSKPLPSLSHLVPAFFSKDNTLNTKFLVMDCLVGAGACLVENSDGDLGRFVAVAVAGLCAGGGGAWGGLKVEGLEKALLAQVRVLRRWWDLVEKVVGSGEIRLEC